MIPALNMTKIHRNSPAGGANGSAAAPVGQGSVSRLHTSRQMSPRTPHITSPRDATSSQTSAHLTRRAAEVAPVLEMNPLHCQSVGELQRKLVETAEWVIKLRCAYALQLQERDQWLNARLRELEKFYVDAVNVAVSAQISAAGNAAASASPTNSSADNRAPSTISASKAGLAAVPHGAPSEGRTTASEKDATTPSRRRRGKQAQNSAFSSIVNSPQPSLPNNAQVDAVSADAIDSSSNSVSRTGASQPKKSAVVRIPQGRRTVSANGVRRHAARNNDAGSPRLAAQTAVDRGETRPTRAARTAAEKELASNSAVADAGAARRRCPPALSASRDTGAFVGGTSGPRFEVLAATVPATTRPGKSAQAEPGASNYLSLSTSDGDRHRTSSGSARRRGDGSGFPHALTTDLAATAPPHSQYLEAGAGLSRDHHHSNTATALRENNGLNLSLGSLSEPPAGRTPRDGSSYFYLLGSGGSRPGRLYSTGASGHASQRSTSRGLSGRTKRKGTNSGNVSAQSSPARVHPL